MEELSVRQKEGVLDDVLLELDRERTKRAELEAKLRSSNLGTRSSSSSSSSKMVTALRVEKEGYLKILEVLTQGKPAVAAAAVLEDSNNNNNKNNNKTLPLHIVRMLEIVPWDPRAQEYAFGVEHVYEWQIYDRKSKQWSGEIFKFPKLFQSLATVRPGKTSILEAVAAGAALQISDHLSKEKNCVLTNENLTKRLNLQQGYPTPTDGGTWKWLGGWRIQKRVMARPKSPRDGSSSSSSADGPQKRVIDCDGDGWSYAQNVTDFVLNPAELCWDNPGDNNNNNDTKSKKDTLLPLRTMRRRQWSRKRVLVDYPHCSEATKEILRLLAENAILAMVSEKLSEQLVDIKTTLTDKEAEHMDSHDEMTRQIQLLRQDLEEKERQLEEAQKINPSPPSPKSPQQQIRNIFIRKSDKK